MRCGIAWLPLVVGFWLPQVAAAADVASAPGISGEILVGIVTGVATAVVALVGAFLTARVTARCAKQQAEATVESAKVQADATVRSATLQAQTTMEAVRAQIQEEQQSRMQLSRQDLSQKLAVVSSALVRPTERLMSRLVSLCTLDTLRCAGFDAAKAFPQNVDAYDRIFERYRTELDLNAPHSGANSRCTLIVYLFRCLGAIGNWRDKVIQLVPVTDELMSSAVYQLRRIEFVLSSPVVPGEQWFSREHLDMVEDVFTPSAGTDFWDTAVEKIRQFQQLQYAAQNVDKHFLGMFDQNAQFMTLRARQTRGALIAVLLIDLVHLVLPSYRFPFSDRRDDIWNIVIRDFAKQQQKRGQEVAWRLYRDGDVLGDDTKCPDAPRGEEFTAALGRQRADLVSTNATGETVVEPK